MQDVPETATINKEEIFGPVVTIQTFKTEEEAIELANDSDYGLSSHVYTLNINRALRVTNGLEAGSTFVRHTQMYSVVALRLTLPTSADQPGGCSGLPRLVRRRQTVGLWQGHGRVRPREVCRPLTTERFGILTSPQLYRRQGCTRQHRRPGVECRHRHEDR